MPASTPTTMSAKNPVNAAASPPDILNAARKHPALAAKDSSPITKAARLLGTPQSLGSQRNGSRPSEGLPENGVRPD